VGHDANQPATPNPRPRWQSPALPAFAEACESTSAQSAEEVAERGAADDGLALYDNCLYTGHMANVSIRELTRSASRVVDGVVKTRRPALITRHGEPVAALVPVDPEGLEDYLLANAPAFVRSLRHADRALAEGKTRAAAEVFDELDREPGHQRGR
jgi:prevent-host-death family protein